MKAGKAQPGDPFTPAQAEFFNAAMGVFETRRFGCGGVQLAAEEAFDKAGKALWVEILKEEGLI